jgi:hypothetical protein
VEHGKNCAIIPAVFLRKQVKYPDFRLMSRGVVASSRSIRREPWAKDLAGEFVLKDFIF